MARLHAMQSMELSDEQQLDAAMPIPMPDRPRFPYGLRVCLTDAEFEKLDIDPGEAFVGGTIHLHAMARVTSVSMNEGADGEKCCRVELQIEDLAVESEDDENLEY